VNRDAGAGGIDESGVSRNGVDAPFVAPPVGQHHSATPAARASRRSCTPHGMNGRRPPGSRTAGPCRAPRPSRGAVAVHVDAGCCRSMRPTAYRAQIRRRIGPAHRVYVSVPLALVPSALIPLPRAREVAHAARRNRPLSRRPCSGSRAAILGHTARREILVCTVVPAHSSAPRNGRRTKMEEARRICRGVTQPRVRARTTDSCTLIRCSAPDVRRIRYRRISLTSECSSSLR